MDKLLAAITLILVALSVTKGQERRCDVPADVVFLMDASDSIKDTEWDQEKNFVSELIDNLEVDRYAIHVGVIVYSTELGQVIDLQPFKTKSQLKALLRQAAQINQGTDTAKAISKMVEMSEGQGRFEAGAKQIAVIITDGRSTDVAATIREARRARLDHHVEMIALGVGNETFLEEMVEIVGPQNRKRLFQVKDFSQLRDVVAELQDLICEIIPATTTAAATTSTITTTEQPTTSPDIPPLHCSRPADLVLLIDGSYSITPPDWVKGKQFVTYLINSLDIALDSFHVGIVVYGSDIGDVVPLQPFKDKTSLKAAAAGLIQPPVGRTNTALGLQTVREMFSTQTRSNFHRIAIVITDGMSSNPSETRDQAAMAKSEGITILVVGVGDRVLRQEVEEMASSPQSLFDAPDFGFLVGMVQLLRDNICAAIPVTTTATAAFTTSTTATLPTIPELCKQCLVEGGVGFNPSPTDCDKYIMCVPQGLTYVPHTKSCPFGMFWSSVAVSCLDARFVDCPSDKCKALPTPATYHASSSDCRSYYSCSNSRSTPHCCDTGHRYVMETGCTPDPTCLDPCPLNATIYNQGACQYRPDPASYYSYMEAIPGQGQVRRSCDPGQVYSQSKCSCTFNAEEVIPSLACTPDVNLTFDGNFENHAHSLSQPINVHRVGLTNSGSAYFGGDGSLTLPGTSGKDFGSNFILKLKFRIADSAPEKRWNDNGHWGFQSWFNNASSHGNTHPAMVGQSEVPELNVAPPKGSKVESLEVITVTRNGTIIRDPRYDFRVNSTASVVNQSAVDIIQLGDIGTLSTPTIVNGIVLVPIGNKKVLVHESVEGASGSFRPTWKIVSLNHDGQSGVVEVVGHGAVPLSVQEKYGFDLRPPVQEKWFVLAPGGVVLQNGDGPIPEDVKNRYSGFTPGTVVKVYERGGLLERWHLSKPDGSQVQEGAGPLPQNLVDLHKLEKVLSPHQTSTTWSLLSSDGKILETGTGELPPNIGQVYASNPSVTILKSTSRDGRDPHWEVTRPSGVKVIEGQGRLPLGISRFVQGDLLLPQISAVNRWTVTLPDGTVRNGTGQIPPEIANLFRTVTSSSATIHSPAAHLSRKWAVTLPDGTVQSGEGPMPASLRALMEGQGSGLEKRWQVTLPDGSERSGVGEVPSDLMTLLQGKRRRRAVNSGPRTMDLISNCGTDPSMTPSVHVYASDSDVTLNLVTSTSPSGVNLTLPLTVGGNDVMFTFNGSQLVGLANGYVSKVPVQGDVHARSSPLVVGQCAYRPDNHFVGDLEELQIYFCGP